MRALVSLFVGLSLASAAPEAEDFDKDGIIDVEDDCPTDPGNKAGKGCPAEAKPPPPEPPPAKPRIEVGADKIELKETIQFKTGSASVDPRSFSLVKEIADGIKTLPPAKKIVVAGHTDDRGARKKNVDLSEKRAQAVVAHLVRHGIARERLSAVGHGPDKPIADNKSEDGRMKNRRVEFNIVDGP